MAGMSITVCLPAREAGRVEAAVAESMAPFERDYTRGDDLDIWDSWRNTGGTVHGGGFNTSTLTDRSLAGFDGGELRE